MIRHFISGMFIAFFCIQAFSGERLTRPNILLIITDEHNAIIMGCAGDKLIRTPHLNNLASQGVLFNAHYCSSPICIPSRQSLTTGKYVSHHNVWGNTVGVQEGTPSLARELNSAGYESFLIGKMHYKGGMSHGYTLLDSPNRKNNENAGDPVPAKVSLRKRLPAGEFPDRGNELGGEFSPLGEVNNLDAFIDVERRDRAIQFIRGRNIGDKPFFLTVGLISPHYPLVAPPEYLEHYFDRVPMPDIPKGYLEGLPLNYKHLRNDRKFERVPSHIIKLARESYYARVEWTDHQIGQILDALKASPVADNTVVIYTSDHGENLGEHGLWWKNCMFDSAVRVPLIISSPSRWKGAQQRNGACSAVDLVQTICDMGGTKAPANWNGRSFLPWLDNPNYPWRDLAISEFYSGYIASGMAMIRQGDWKYVYHTRADETHGPERELYDLRDDPKELRNLSKELSQQPRIAKMHADLVKELGEEPEKSELRWRAGATPESPSGLLEIRKNP